MMVMTPREAIERFKRIKEGAIYLIYQNEIPSTFGIHDDKEYTLCNMAIEALEKQTPMRVKVTPSTKRCGRCSRKLSGINNIHTEKKFCPGCGQAVEWE